MKLENKKDITKQEELKNIIRTRFNKTYNADIDNDTIQFILDNMCLIRHHKLIFHTSANSLDSEVYNGYIRDIGQDYDLIRRRVQTVLVGSKNITIGYRQNKKIINPTVVHNSGLFIIREVVYTTGTRDNDTIYSETFKLHFYLGGGHNEII